MPLTPTQKWIVVVTSILGVLVLAYSAFLARDFYNHTPAPPSISLANVPADKIEAVQGQQTKAITNYQNLLTAMQLRTNTLFDLIVTKVLLPIFNTLIAAVITYVVAKHAAQTLSAYFVSREARRRQ